MQNSHSGFYNNVTGVILAGGLNHRMGQDKATLSIAGTTLFERVERVMRSLFKTTYIAGNRPDLARADLPFYKDAFPGSSLTGLHTALRHASTEWVCVLPCDLPFPSVAVVKSLLNARQEANAVVAQHPDRLEPLVGCYHKNCLPLIVKRLEAKQYKLTGLLGELNVCTLGPPQLPHGWRRALFNVNQPDDLARLTQPLPAVTVVARSGTGKTTLLEKLIRELTLRGWTIGALKHDAHRFEIDREGKDSWRMTQAGAAVTAISSSRQTAIMHRHDLEPGIKEILERDFREVDLVLTEGFKHSDLPKIEIHRHELGHPLLCRGETHDPYLVAVASDTTLALDVPVFDLNRTEAMGTFIERTFLE
jgi:molybdopterin-guanine dinucleotide biosynthesis protein B/molybdopterin-guanine dinucleotide biosynthesis protein